MANTVRGMVEPSSDVRRAQMRAMVEWADRGGIDAAEQGHKWKRSKRAEVARYRAILEDSAAPPSDESVPA